MIRTQIQLTEEQLSRLKELAAARSCSVAELVRDGVERVIQGATLPPQSEVRARAREASGKCGSGLGDLSSKHERYLAESSGW